MRAGAVNNPGRPPVTVWPVLPRLSALEAQAAARALFPALAPEPWFQEYLDQRVNLPASFFAEGPHGGLAGIYLLGDRQVSSEGVAGYEHLRGIEGVFLAVAPEWRGRGVGRQLITASLAAGYDYVWGLQLFTLNNLSHWLKRRIKVGENEDSHITLELARADRPREA